MALRPARCQKSPLYYSPDTAGRVVEYNNEYYKHTGQLIKMQVIRCDDCNGWHIVSEAQ